VLVDYRPALRHRSGAGEYIARLFDTLARQRASDDALYLFSSSWRDRVRPDQISPGVEVLDMRIPVRLLNLAWHRLDWPPIERITRRRFDVVHAPHPLRIPSMAAAQVVTIHDLHFLDHPEDTAREIRRDYADLVRAHATGADHIVVISASTAGEVEARLGVPRHRITVCRAGGPDWPARTHQPSDGPILFVGTLEPRKNIGVLLDAYQLLLARESSVPDLVLAGRATDAAAGWLARLKTPPLAGRVRHLGYVSDEERRELYQRARLLVLPSLDEGFGMPVLEAMTLGVPVVASNRGALPEVLGDAGLLVEPIAAALAAALAHMTSDRAFAGQCAARGVRRAGLFTWAASARALRGAYEAAMAQRDERLRGEPRP
jgi:glycosyltransferase involved in cell wall biosynthesis